jgi:hypothetical protein
MLKDLSLPIVDTAFLIAKSDIKELGELHEIKVKKSNLVKPEAISINFKIINKYLYIQ